MAHLCQYCDSIITKNYLKKSKVTCRRCSHYHHKYGIRVSDYNELYEKQEGKCAICGSSSSKHNKDGTFCIDHCHETGKVRGLLCVNCNVGIGSLKEDPLIFKKALNYLSDALQT